MTVHNVAVLCVDSSIPSAVRAEVTLKAKEKILKLKTTVFDLKKKIKKLEKEHEEECQSYEDEVAEAQADAEEVMEKVMTVVEDRFGRKIREEIELAIKVAPYPIRIDY